jgi:hypothetical protein
LNLRLRCGLAAGLSLAAGIFVFLYRGPGWKPLRHSAGDFIVVLFLHFSAAVVVPGRPRGLALGVWVFACVIEALQMLRLTSPSDPWWVQASFGSTFDPWDLLAYSLGALCAGSLHRRLLQGAQGVG